MRRTWWRAFVLTSFALCLATVSLWVRSYSRSDSIHRWRRDVAGPGTYHDTTGIFSTRGAIGAGYLRMDLPATQEWSANPRWRVDTQPAYAIGWPHRWWFLGFGYWNMRYPPGPAYRGLHPIGGKVPHWFVALLFAIPPAAWARRARLARRERWRIAAKLCAACGYDVRASGGRCPECGLPVPSPGSSVDG